MKALKPGLRLMLGLLIAFGIFGFADAQQVSNSIDASVITKAEEAALLEHLRGHSSPATEFVVGQFEHHDIVLLGETHQVAENCQFVASLLQPLHAAGVDTLAWEFTRSRSNDDLQRLVTADEFDHELAKRLFRDHPWPTWGYQEYAAILRSAWKLNHELSDGEPQFRLVGIESDNWNQHELFFGNQTQLQYFQQMMAREKHMTQVVRDATADAKRKALVYTGWAHTNTKQGIRVGKALRDEYGSRVKQVVLHHSWPMREGKRSAMTQLIERLVAGAGDGQAIGFDIVESPLNRLVDADIVFWKSLPNARLSSFAESYVFLKPLNDLHGVTWIPGFIDEENFAQARDVASRMKWVDKDKVTNAKQLDEALQQRFSGKLVVDRP